MTAWALCRVSRIGNATLYSLSCELPSLSRPLYECILTGVRPVDSGVVHNQVVRLSHNDSIFSLAQKPENHRCRRLSLDQ